jgi:hypothetical protein
MAFGSFSRFMGVQGLKLRAPATHIGRVFSPHCRTVSFHYRQPSLLQQRRTLVTAVTYSPRIIIPPSDPQPPPKVVGSLVDAAILWASRRQPQEDPPTHAVILISKALIPTGEEELLQALSQSNSLRGLNALVGVVDYIGDGAKGASVLLASKSENVTIERLKGVQKEDLRVGRWHAKDVEEEGPIDFDNMMASIRGTAASPVVVSPTSSSSESDLLFVLGEAEGIQGQVSVINQMFPKASIVCVSL